MNAATVRHLQNAIRNGKIVKALTIPIKGILGIEQEFTITIIGLHLRQSAEGNRLTARTKAGETLAITDAWISH